MASQLITLELPDGLYLTVSKLAQVTQRPVGEIVQESLTHTLPPLRACLQTPCDRQFGTRTPRQHVGQ